VTYCQPEARRNVVLLGAGSEIGAAIIDRLLAEDGSRVLAVSRRQISSSDCSSSLMRLSGIDLTQQSSLERLTEAVEKEFDTPFTIIHSVGDFWVHRPLIGTPFEEIARMIASHLTTLFGVARFLTPKLIANGGGRLLAFSCNSVAYNYPDMSPFTASKAAIESFIRCYGNEHSQFGIIATALALPTIRTEAVLREKPNGDHDNYITSEELAEFIVSEILPMSALANGNVVKVFKHSPSFYNTSYYDRNPRRGG
jgi:NAD(P)-dependent dehydrogenase (short-subunit alcohol dehydrogenase family)